MAKRRRSDETVPSASEPPSLRSPPISIEWSTPQQSREEIFLRNFRCLDAIINGLSSRRTPPLVTPVLEGVVRMTGENFVEKDLVMIVSICPEAYLLKSSSSGGVSISINTLWPPRPHATGKASHVAAESRLTEFRRLLTAPDFPQPSSAKTLQSLLDVSVSAPLAAASAAVNTPLGSELIPLQPKKVRAKSNSLREVLDLVSSQQNLGVAFAPLSSVSIDSLREDVVRRSDINASKQPQEFATQQQIDHLTIVSFFATAADLIRLFYRCEKRCIFSLLEIAKCLSSLHLNVSASFTTASTPVPRASFASAKLPLYLRNEHAVLVLLSEAVPEFLTILPSDEAQGVSFPTVRVNPAAPMAEVREKLLAMSAEAVGERERLVRKLSKSFPR